MVNVKLAVAALASLASAVPATFEQRDDFPEGAKLVDHNYEDAPSRLPLVPITEAGEYKGLLYEGFVYVDTGVDGTLIAGIEPSSPPVVVASSDVSKTLGQARSRVTIKDSDSDNFDFKSFNFGCTVNPIAVAVVGVPTPCLLTVTGFDNEDRIVVTKHFGFGQEGIKQPMKHVDLDDDFSGISAVQFTATAPPATDLVATLFDDMVFRLYDYN